MSRVEDFFYKDVLQDGLCPDCRESKDCKFCSRTLDSFGFCEVCVVAGTILYFLLAIVIELMVRKFEELVKWARKDN